MAAISFLIAFVAAYWVYSDARGRGHDLGSALLWSLGTLAMLIIVFPLYLLLGRKPRMKSSKTKPDIIDVEATVVDETTCCTMCGGKVKEEFKICPYCGYTLKPKCRSCGRELERGWKKCPYCQAAIEEK
ncbi:MAG: zinc ribbon domain-containing protein [Veillonellales bacterium]